MHDLEGDGPRIKGLPRQVQQDGGIFSDRVEQDRPAEHGLGFPQDMDGFGLQHALVGAEPMTTGEAKGRRGAGRSVHGPAIRSRMNRK